MSNIRVLLVAGARPNFMKIAPLLRALTPEAGFDPVLVHTGQHFSPAMSALFFQELRIPEPYVNLDVGSGTHARQTAEIMTRFEPVLQEVRPDWVLVVGDVNSTLACAIVAKKLGYPVAHVEAGLRSFDRRMPEEINRIVTDSISDLFFTTEASASDNLQREGVTADRIHLVGNVMIDTLAACRARSAESDILGRLGLTPESYGVLTLHRPENVDSAAALGEIWQALATIAEEVPLIFPVHPRTAAALKERGLAHAGVRCIEPQGYMDFLCLLSRAKVVLTDSGGIQEETTILGVPCLTLRDNTERPVTIERGTNRLAGTSAEAILDAWRANGESPRRSDGPPPLWDGRAAERIAAVLRRAGREARSGLATRAASV